MSSQFNTKKTGNVGEKIAEEYLKNNGYRIIATNWFYKHKEIDIIAEKDSFLVIVEVKTRAKNYLIDPMYAVTKQKQKFLIEAADHYIQIKNIAKEVRFDVISIVIDGQNHIIEHYDDAFYPTL